MAIVIGIDLGTTNSCVAVMQRTTPKVIENAEADAHHAVDRRVYRRGRAAGSASSGKTVRRCTNPERTIFAVKRLVGRRYDDPMLEKDKKLVPYKITRASNGDAWVEAEGKSAIRHPRFPPSSCRR